MSVVIVCSVSAYITIISFVMRKRAHQNMQLLYEVSHKRTVTHQKVSRAALIHFTWTLWTPDVPDFRRTTVETPGHLPRPPRSDPVVVLTVRVCVQECVQECVCWSVCAGAWAPLELQRSYGALWEGDVTLPTFYRVDHVGRFVSSVH